MLALSQQHGLLPLTLALVSALSVPEVLIERGLAGDGEEENRTPKHLLILRYRYPYPPVSLQGLRNILIFVCNCLVSQVEVSPSTLRFYSNTQ